MALCELNPLAINGISSQMACKKERDFMPWQKFTSKIISGFISKLKTPIQSTDSCIIYQA